MNKRFQLSLLKELIKEEIKLQKKKNLFEDVASTVTSTDAATMVKLDTPELKVEKTSTGFTIFIYNVKGFKFFTLQGFDEYYNIEYDIIPMKNNNDNLIKVNYTINITKDNVSYNLNKKFLDATNFEISTSDVKNKETITLKILKNEYSINHINQFYGVDGWDIKQKIEIFHPKTIQYQKTFN